MVFNFRKIASVIASTVMVGSTVALAAAANYPAPFVQNGNADVALVYGSKNAAATDYTALIEISSNLQTALARQTATSAGGSTGSSTTVSGGDYVKLERSSDKFNLADTATEFYSTMDSDELSSVLKKGVYSNDLNDEYDFDQKIELAALALEHFQDSDYNDEKPTIGFHLASGAHVLNYTLDFTPDNVPVGANMVNLETTDLTLLGRTYYVLDAKNTSGTNHEISLLDTANSAIVAEGETKEVVVGDKTYKVSISYVGASDAILDVNGVQTNKLVEGSTYKIAADTYLAVKSILYSSKEAGISKVEFSIGSGKIVLKNTQEVEVNGDSVEGLTGYITMNGNDLDKVIIEWKTDEEQFITPTTSLVMPGFETIKVSMGDFYVPSMETTKISPDGESIKLTTTVEQGTLNLNVLYVNSTGPAGLGKSSSRVLLTNATTSPTFLLNEAYDNQFVATWISGNDAESYAYEISSITLSDGKNKTVLNNLVVDGADITFDEVGDNEVVGRAKFTLVAASDAAGTAQVKAEQLSAGTVYGDRLVTKGGLTMTLPVISSTSTAQNALNISNAPTTWVMNLTEESATGSILGGSSFTATLGQVSAKGSVTAVSVTDYETSDGSDNYEGYVASDFATKTLYKTGGDQDSLEITYSDTESYADVFIAESGAVIAGTNASSSTTTTTTSTGVKELGAPVVADADVASVATKNLIVVGGSCVNSVAAELLGVSATTCGSGFETATGISNGQALIKTFSRGGKIATLVAGYNAADTTNAAKYLTTQTVDITAGKAYKVTSATAAEPIVTVSTNSTA